jgi:MFS family permease
MLVSIHAELGMNLFLDGLLMQGGQLGQVIGPPVLALMVSMGGGWKSAPWLLGGAAAVGVALSLWGWASWKKGGFPHWARQSAIRDPISVWGSIFHRKSLNDDGSRGLKAEMLRIEG